MSGHTLTLATQTEFYIESCYSCGVQFGMTADFRANRLRAKDTFYCPSGHSQHYLGKSDKELRREAEDRARAAEDQARAAETARRAAVTRANKAKAETARLRKRGEAGVCPHCQRSFVQLARHVKTKHPECSS